MEYTYSQVTFQAFYNAIVTKAVITRQIVWVVKNLTTVMLCGE